MELLDLVAARRGHASTRAVTPALRQGQPSEDGRPECGETTQGNSRTGSVLGGQSREAQVQTPQTRHEIMLVVNGVERALSVDARTTLLDVIRDHLHITGTKKGCELGQCGACTVLLDGRRVVSCLTFAVMCDGASVVTVEGLAHGETLHPLQEAFIACDAFQCGYCTPGQIVSAVGLLREAKASDPQMATDPSRIREAMSGNLCRCGAYGNIVEAIRRVAEEA